MSLPDIITRARGLSTRPTPEHPFGLRYAVIERAAILHYDAGMSVEDADAEAWVLEVNGGQRSLRVGT